MNVVVDAAVEKNFHFDDLNGMRYYLMKMMMVVVEAKLVEKKENEKMMKNHLVDYYYCY